MVSNILNPEAVKVARGRYLDIVLREIKLCSRRADEPEDRAALAELERELLTIEKRWCMAGLVVHAKEL
jgi:hypothetical protein